MSKVVLITGGVRNSGLAIAKKFASQGYDVCVTSRVSQDAQAVAQTIASEYGVSTIGFGLNLEDVSDIRRVFGEVKEKFGRLDAFVGNSANLGIGPAAIETSPEQFDAVMNVNIRGNFFCCQEAARLMKEHHSGSIVLIGSVHSRGAVWGRSTYAISKGAIASMVHNLAFEFAEYGIRVNQILPGAIRTNRWDGIAPEEEARRRKNWPLGIESTGEDIANAVYFIASDLAKTITGADLAVDSGTLACLQGYNGGKH